MDRAFCLYIRMRVRACVCLFLLFSIGLDVGCVRSRQNGTVNGNRYTVQALINDCYVIHFHCSFRTKWRSISLSQYINKLKVHVALSMALLIALPLDWQCNPAFCSVTSFFFTEEFPYNFYSRSSFISTLRSCHVHFWSIPLDGIINFVVFFNDWIPTSPGKHYIFRIP